MMADAAAGKSVEPLKIFVGGLSWDSTKESMKAHFSKYGEVEDTIVMIDNMTKKPRGFGFVTFKETDSVKKALEHKDQVLDGKTIDPKEATTKGSNMSAGRDQSTSADPTQLKVFVGGLAAGTTEEDVANYFGQHGKVKSVDMKIDKTSQRMRGFGFVEFEDPRTVERVCQLHFHQINDKSVEAKKAEPRMPSGRNGNFPGQDYAATAYGRSNPYTQYSTGYAGYPGYAQQQQQQQQAVQQQQQAQYYGYSYAGGTYNQGDQAYGAGQQASASVPAGQPMTSYTPATGTSYGASASRTATGYTGSDNYSTQASYSYQQDGRAQAAQTSGYQQHFDNQGSNNFQRSMGQRANYDYTTS